MSRQQWLEASGEAEQKHIAAAMQVQAFEDVPYIPLGQMLVPVAHRAALTGMPNGFSMFWNVQLG